MAYERVHNKMQEKVRGIMSPVAIPDLYDSRTNVNLYEEFDGFGDAS